MRKLLGRMPMEKSLAIDWTTLHERLAKARVALEAASKPSPALLAMTLKARSRQIAQEPQAQDAGRPAMRVLEFLLAPESYAVPCNFVQEVAALREYAALPHAPAFVIGVTYLRGRMISIMDLRRFFGLPAPGITDLNRVIVLGHDALEVGFLADRVIGVDNLHLDELGEPLPAHAGRSTYARGIGTGGLIVLDVPRLLSPEGLVKKSGASRASTLEEAT